MSALWDILVIQRFFFSPAFPLRRTQNKIDIYSYLKDIPIYSLYNDPPLFPVFSVTNILSISDEL